MFNSWRTRNTTLVLLWFVFLVAYLDRVNFAVTVPMITKELSLTPTQVGAIMSAFFVGYGLFQIIGGIMADKFGARKAMTIALLWWSVFTLVTGLVNGFFALLIVRAFFGVGEAMQPPASWKLISTWFPPKERVRANALNLCSIALGPAFAPLLVVMILQYFNWRSVFYIFAIPGFIIAYLIWKYIRNTPEEHTGVTAEELAEIKEEPVAAAKAASNITMMQAARDKNVLLLTFIYFAFGVPFWGFLSWLPSYLVTVRHFTMVKMGITASIPFFTAFVGMLITNSLCNSVFRGNKQAFLAATWVFGGVFMYLAYAATDPNMCILYLSLASAGMFMCFGPFWALPMGILPSNVMGFASGIINTGGQIGGFVAPLLIGYLIQTTGGSYQAAFAMMAGALVLSAILALFVKEKKVA